MDGRNTLHSSFHGKEISKRGNVTERNELSIPSGARDLQLIAPQTFRIEESLSEPLADL
jgi:hypothetical protein